MMGKAAKNASRYGELRNLVKTLMGVRAMNEQNCACSFYVPLMTTDYDHRSLRPCLP